MSCSTRLVSLFCVLQNKEWHTLCGIYLSKKGKEQSQTDICFISKWLSLSSFSHPDQPVWPGISTNMSLVQTASVLLQWAVHMFLCDPASMEKNRFTNQFCRNRPGFLQNTYFLPVFDYGIFPLTGLIRDRDSWLMWLRFTSSDWQWTGWSTNLSSGIWMIWSASFFTMFVKGITKLHKHDSRSGYGVIWVWFQNTFRTTRDQKQLFMP